MLSVFYLRIVNSALISLAIRNTRCSPEVYFYLALDRINLGLGSRSMSNSLQATMCACYVVHGCSQVLFR